MERFDAIIIGTGQAGKPLAGALARASWSVAVIEQDRVGGTCVIDGCTPTKTMIASARVAHLARRSDDYGIRTGPVQVDMRRVRERKRAVVDMFSEGSRKGLERHERIELVFGTASFQAPHEILVRPPANGTAENPADTVPASTKRRALKAPRIFINTGTRTRVPDLPGLEDVPWLDNASVMELASVPEHLIILGGGFIGLEFGQMFRRLGARVSIIERSPRLVEREDEDVSEALRTILEDEGIEVHTDTEAIRVWRDAAEIRLDVRNPSGDTTVEGSHLLLAPGRAPNTESLNLKVAGIERDERGFIRVNERLETSVAGVYALGDVNGGPPFTHVSYDDFRVVRENLLGEGDADRQERLLPYTLFTDPQLGRVGPSEREARARGLEFRVARLPMSRVARAIETDETRGFMKALVEERTDRVLGAAVLGVEGGELASVLQVAIMGGLPYTRIRDAIFAHPTLAESLNNLFMTLDA